MILQTAHDCAMLFTEGGFRIVSAYSRGQANTIRKRYPDRFGRGLRYKHANDLKLFWLIVNRPQTGQHEERTNFPAVIH